MSDLKRENILNRRPADMHADGVRFQNKNLKDQEKNVNKEDQDQETEKILKEKKPSK